MSIYDENHRMALQYRKTHPPGTRIELLATSETLQPVPIGTRGTIDHIDDQCGIHMKWDNGRTLALMPGEDSFRKLTAEEIAEENGGTLSRLGDDCQIIVPNDTVDCSPLGFFDELEERCWQLVKDYCDTLGIKILKENGEEPISFDIVKEIQDGILEKLQESGVQFDFDGQDEGPAMRM